MLRRFCLLALALQLLLPAHVLQAILAAATPAPTVKAGAKTCPCSGAAQCKCCGCNDDEPEPEADNPAPKRDNFDPGPHGCVCCPCHVAQALASVNVYLPNHAPILQALCQPQQERLNVRPESHPSAILPIDSPPPKPFA